MKNVLVVTATKTATLDEFLQRPLGNSLKNLYDHYQHVPHCSLDFQIVSKNTDGLSTVYNRFLIEENKNKIVLFVHDDVIIQSIDLVEQLNKAMESFDVVGLAGSSDFKVGDVAWHLHNGQWREQGKLSGMVGHSIDGKYNNSVYGEVPKRCVVMDGLFLAVNVEKIIEKEVKFQEDFKFNFYDLNFCLDCNKNGLKLGTWNIPVTHFSGGGGVNGYGSENWQKDAAIFVDICKESYK